jgi:hypothetical protein
MGAPFSMVVTDQNGNYRGNLMAEAKNTVLSTIWPGGCFQLTCSLPRRAILNYPDLDYPFDVKVSDGQGVFWRGRMEKRQRRLHRQG